MQAGRLTERQQTDRRTICSDEGQTIQMSALETLSGGQTTLSTHLMKPNYVDTFIHRPITTVSLKPPPFK